MNFFKQELTKNIVRVLVILVSILIDIYVILQVQPYGTAQVPLLAILIVVSSLLAMIVFSTVPPIEIGLSRVAEPLSYVGFYLIALVSIIIVSDYSYQWGFFFGIFLPTTYTLLIVPFDITELIPSNRIILLVGYALTRLLILFVYLYMMGMVTI